MQRSLGISRRDVSDIRDRFNAYLQGVKQFPLAGGRARPRSDVARLQSQFFRFGDAGSRLPAEYPLFLFLVLATPDRTGARPYHHELFYRTF
jgi:hypothetical protein